MKDTDIYQVLYHVAISGIGATAIYSGTNFLAWLYTLISGKEMPGQARAIASIGIALVVPPLCYAVLLVDSGLVRFDFRSLVAVVGVAFMSAWGWYQSQKYGKA